jgi:hypothetical protein
MAQKCTARIMHGAYKEGRTETDGLKRSPVSVRNDRSVSSLFMRLSVGSRGMFLCEFAMLVSCSCVLLGIFVLAERVVMLGLMMMMRRGVVLSSR